MHLPTPSSIATSHGACRAVRLVPSLPHPDDPWERLQHALDGPLLTLDPVTDAAGTAYGFDLVVQDGAYVLIALMCLWRVLRS